MPSPQAKAPLRFCPRPLRRRASCHSPTRVPFTASGASMSPLAPLCDRHHALRAPCSRRLGPSGAPKPSSQSPFLRPEAGRQMTLSGGAPRGLGWPRSGASPGETVAATPRTTDSAMSWGRGTGPGHRRPRRPGSQAVGATAWFQAGTGNFVDFVFRKDPADNSAENTFREGRTGTGERGQGPFR